jgi:hypothetical protein
MESGDEFTRTNIQEQAASDVWTRRVPPRELILPNCFLIQDGFVFVYWRK